MRISKGSQEDLFDSAIRAISSSQELGNAMGMVSGLIILEKTLRETPRPPQLTREQWSKLRGEIFEKFRSGSAELLEIQKQFSDKEESKKVEGSPPPPPTSPTAPPKKSF